MLGMRFPIDLVWIAEGRVVKIIDTAPPPKNWILSLVFPYFLKRYRCDAPAEMMVEVRGGFCRSHGIQVGDRVTYE